MVELNIFSDIKNQIATVTGGYGYLGREITKTLSLYGCKVYVLGRSKDKFNQVFKNSDSIFFIETDVSNPKNIQESLDLVGDTEGRIDILINNAYFGATNHPEKMTSEEWRIGINGGINQYFDFIKCTIPYLKKSQNGKIINIASMYGMVVPDLNIYNGREELLNPANYGCSKAAVIHLTKYYAMYLAKYNINVNTISPGPFPSEKVQKDQRFIQRLEAKTKLKRIGKPDDLRGLILLLSSNTSSFITGQNIAIDGGWTL